MRSNTFGSLRTACICKDHPELWKDQMEWNEKKWMTSQLTDDGSRSSLEDVSVKRSADVGPGYHRMVLLLNMKLTATKKGKKLKETI